MQVSESGGIGAGEEEDGRAATRKERSGGGVLTQWFRASLPEGRRFLLLCILAGPLCGLVAVGFHLGIRELFAGVLALRDRVGPVSGYLVLLLAPAAGGLLTGVILRWIEPRATGSGMPQVKDSFHNRFGEIRLREGFWRFVTGAISIGSGNSLGRAAPTVHISITVATGLARLFRMTRRRVQAMVPVGMGAGLAAAFNTPLAAITFVFEELLEDFSSKVMGAILIAVVLAALVERALLGERPVFDVGEMTDFTMEPWMLIALPLGLVAAASGHFFVGLVLRVRRYFAERAPVPRLFHPALGGLMVGIIGCTVLFLTGQTGIFSIGHEDLNYSLQAQHTWQILLLLFVGKLFATALCFGAGGSGGLFAPTLFLGTMLGGSFGYALVEAFGLGREVAAGCALLGMGAFFAAVIRCPLTSVIIAFEMTQNYSLILPLMVGNMLAYFLASRWRAIPVYEAILLQDHISLRRMPNYRGEQDWKNLPVSVIMTHRPTQLRAAATAQEAFAGIREHHHAYPVVDGKGWLCGVYTDHELREAVDHEEGHRSVRELLPSRKPVTVYPDDSIREVANTLVLQDVMQAPVVSRKEPRRVVGIVTLHDVARQQNAIIDRMEQQGS